MTTYTDKLWPNYTILDKEGDDVYSLHRTCLGPMLRLQGILHNNLKQTKYCDVNHKYLNDNSTIP